MFNISFTLSFLTLYHAVPIVGHRGQGPFLLLDSPQNWGSVTQLYLSLDFRTVFSNVFAKMYTVPDVGLRRVVRILRVVVFPAPFGPRNPNTVHT